MIPVQLTIEGLYSYQQRQTIDFSDLTDAGLFGIFGKVGSGKSSILEAITYALYGETERLNARDKRTYNMMNLKSNRSYIEFDFYNFENRLFRATREFKRNSKNFEDVKTPLVVFYEYKDTTWIPLERADAESIIGLSYTNFKRTIIIPQGQFKEFLELGETARTQMMKEIFNLGRYDLQDKVSSLNKINQSELDQLQGKLSGYETISPEHIDEKKQQLSVNKNQLEPIQEKFKEVDEEYQLLKALKADFEILQEKKKSFEEYQQKKEAFDLKKSELETYEHLYKVFQPLLHDEKRLSSEIQQKKTALEQQQHILKDILSQITDVTAQLEKVRPDYEKLPSRRQEETDLEHLAELRSFAREVEQLQLRSAKGKEKVEEVLKNEQAIDLNIKSLEKELFDVGLRRMDPAILLEVSKWFTQQQYLQTSLEKQETNLQLQHSELEKISQEAQALHIDITTFDDTHQIKIDQLHTIKSQLEQQREHLLIQQQMVQYAHELHDGAACPLCGALEHPSVVKATDVSAQLAEIRQKILDIDARQKQAQEQANQVQRWRDREKIYAEQWAKEQRLFQQIKSQMDVHQAAFGCEGFDAHDPQDFEAKKQKAKEVENEINSLTTAIAAQRKAWENERQNLDKFKVALEQFRLTEAQLQSKIEVNKSKLKVLRLADYLTQSSEDVQKEWQVLQEQNLHIEKLFLQLQQQWNDLNPKSSAQQATISLLQEQITALDLAKSAVAAQLTRSMDKEGIESLDFVHRILAQELDTVLLRKELEEFTIQFETLKQTIDVLQSKLKEVSFDEQHFSSKVLQWNELTRAIQAATDDITRIELEISQLTKAFEEKKELLHLLDKLEKRASNLKVMTNLFKGSGFVQYVSSIYLQQLCNQANIRFHRMTRNQLSLQLNASHDIEIIDYLNEGRSRSVKTLSGGQSFQASLSLALALAESIQSNARADKNFFFIDEGFGTQDTESVNIVFETLTSLQKENRIVGIISHVEELKDRIPLSINIKKDEEKGSLIVYE